MKFKRIIGAVLTALGISGLIFAGVFFLIHFWGVYDERIPITSGLISVIFFTSGVALVRGTIDKM